MAPRNEAFDSQDQSTPVDALFAHFGADHAEGSVAQHDARVGLGPDVRSDVPADDDRGSVPVVATPESAAPEASSAPAASAVEPVVPAPAIKPHSRFRKPLLIGVAALVAALTIGGGTIAAMAKTVTIAVDGQTRQVTTLSDSVDGALQAAGLKVGAHDSLAPAGAVSISDGSQIALNRARLFTLTIDGKQVKVWTTARTVDAALAEIGRNPADYQLSANRSRAIPLDGLTVTGASLHNVSVLGANGARTSVSTAARTVADVLAQQGITLGKNDRVSPALSTVVGDGVVITVRTLPTIVIADGAGKAASAVSGLRTVGDLIKSQGITVGKDDVLTPVASTPLHQGLRITITRVGFQLQTRAVVIAQPADQTINDDTMDKGTTNVTQQGQAGTLEITYRTKVTNGKPGVAQEISRKVLKQAIGTITHVGTYVAPPVVTTSSSAPTTRASATTAAGSTAAGTTPAGTVSTKVSTSAGSAPAGSAAYYDNPSHWSVNWDNIAHCESTNNWSINTGNGYYGGLQFDFQTWIGAGGGQYADRADHATKSQQIAIAEKVYAARGLSPWACGYAA